MPSSNARPTITPCTPLP
ncbi:hypothetical protein YPPY32_2100, partial [Yersinia pestis PY-32]